MVTRYELYHCETDAHMSEHPQGEYVSYDDYSELFDKYEEIKDLIAELHFKA